MYTWNDKNLERRYSEIVEKAKNDYRLPYKGHNEELFTTPTLESWKFPTKSVRIWQFIYLAYTLGQMRAIKSIDEGKTPVILS